MVRMPQIDQFNGAELECVPRCPYCDAGGVRELFVENGFPYVQCTACTLIYLRVRVHERYISRIYDAPYHSPRNPSYARVQARKRLALLGPISRGQLIVEDGSGNGAFVAVACEQGLQARGCDLGLNSIETARALFGVELTHGQLIDLALPPASVSAVASFNLLSHLYEPWKYIRQVAGLLRPGGRWVCRTGDRSGLMSLVGRGQWSAPEHVYHFTLAVLTRMIVEAGLHIVSVKPAFDSDFPFFLLGFSRRGRSLRHRVAAYSSSAVIRLWSTFGLPKEDVYLVAERR